MTVFREFVGIVFPTPTLLPQDEVPRPMHIDEIRKHCLRKAAVTEDFPFDEDTLVFRVAGKIFLLASLERIPLSINLKCDPEQAIELRERHASVLPGYHMNKKHWNTVVMDGELSATEVRRQIDHSYALVAASLSKKLRAEHGLDS